MPLPTLIVAFVNAIRVVFWFAKQTKRPSIHGERSAPGGYSPSRLDDRAPRTPSITDAAPRSAYAGAGTVQRQADRFPLQLPVEIYASGRRHVVATRDVSATGMFVCDAAIPLDAEVRLAMVLDGVRHVTAARVAHVESTGIGVAFRAPTSPIDERFACAIDGLVRRVEPPRLALKGTFPIPVVLAMLEQERATGRLCAGDRCLDLAEGRLVGDMASAIAMLDLPVGPFEFRGRPPLAAPDLALSITYVLMEHARLRDEDSRRHRRASA